MDLSNYSSKELRDLQRQIEREIESRRKEEAREAQRELKAVAEKYGFSLTDLVGGGGSKPRSSGGGRAKGPIKYRHPTDPSKGWTGKGRKPAWLKEWESEGKSVDELRVD